MGKTFNALINAGTGGLGFPPISQIELFEDSFLINGFLYGNYCLSYKEISKVKMASVFPSFTHIDIIHTVATYPSFSLLTTNRSGVLLFNLLKASIDESKTSVLSESGINTIELYRKDGVIPVKKLFQYLISVTWLIFFLSDFLLRDIDSYISNPIGIGAITAFIFLFSICIALLISVNFRKLLLKPGRRLKDIDRSLYYLLVFIIMILVVILRYFNYQM